jgi:hypothetical protein
MKPRDKVSSDVASRRRRYTDPDLRVTTRLPVVRVAEVPPCERPTRPMSEGQVRSAIRFAALLDPTEPV